MATGGYLIEYCDWQPVTDMEGYASTAVSHRWVNSTLQFS